MDFALLVPIVSQFVLRPVKTALATTKEELDAALASADQITVEGDDDLLSYAINRANSAAFKGQIVQVSGSSGAMALAGGKAPKSAGADQSIFAPNGSDGRSNLGDEAVFGDDEERSRPAGSQSPRRAVVIGATAAVVAFLGIAAAIGWVWFALRAEKINAPNTETTPIQHGSPTPQSDFWANLPSLVLALAVVVAIVALYLIARQAISAGSNVTIQWKVTEKVSPAWLPEPPGAAAGADPVPPGRCRRGPWRGAAPGAGG